MPLNYIGVAANATGTAPSATVPVDTDGLTAASIAGAVQSNTDWLRRLSDIALNIAATAFAWTVAQAFPAGTTIARPAPTVPAASSGWDFTSGSNYARYWKDSDGIVHLEAQGTVTSASPSSNPFSAAFPAGFRPASIIPVSVFHVAGAGALGSGAATSIAGALANTGVLALAASVANGDGVFINAHWYGAV